MADTSIASAIQVLPPNFINFSCQPYSSQFKSGTVNTRTPSETVECDSDATSRHALAMEKASHLDSLLSLISSTLEAEKTQQPLSFSRSSKNRNSPVVSSNQTSHVSSSYDFVLQNLLYSEIKTIANDEGDFYSSSLPTTPRTDRDLIGGDNELSTCRSVNPNSSAASTASTTACSSDELSSEGSLGASLPRDNAAKSDSRPKCKHAFAGLAFMRAPRAADVPIPVFN